jgi:hypothetical protein
MFVPEGKFTAIPFFLADSLPGISSDSPEDVLGARRLANGVVVHLHLKEDAARVGELGASRHTNFPATIDDTISDSKVVAVLNQNSVVPVISEINPLDLRSTRHGNTEDTTATTAGVNPVDPDIGSGVLAIGGLTVVVGETKGCVARSRSDIVTLDIANPDISTALKKQTRLATITGNNRLDIQLIDVPDLNSVTTCTADVDVVHLGVVVPRGIAVEADTKTTAQVHRDLAQPQIAGARDAKTEVGIASHGQIRDVDVVHIPDLDSPSAVLPAGIDGTADLECPAGRDVDGVGAEVTRRPDDDTLTSTGPVKGRLDGETIIRATIDVGTVHVGGEGARAGDNALGTTVTTGSHGRAGKSEGNGRNHGGDAEQHFRCRVSCP